jgi:hypothetical protein
MSTYADNTFTHYKYIFGLQYIKQTLYYGRKLALEGDWKFSKTFATGLFGTRYQM